MFRLRSQMYLIVWVLLCAVRLNTTISCCHESDRSLLLMFKEGVVDPSNSLSSWSPQHFNCCQWIGVECDSTNRVTALYLSYSNDSKPLRGEINLSSLLSLQFLEQLHLEWNDFERISKPAINNSVATHTHLQPNSSSKLWFLNLSYNIHLHTDNLHYWLSQLPSLTTLFLSGIHHLSSETKWVQPLASLPLQSLILHDCNLTSSILSVEYVNFSSLSWLELGLNDFRYGLPNWLFNLRKDHFSYLYLGQCNLRGHIPDFSSYRNLRILHLFDNKFKGSIPDWLGQLERLTELDLSNNSLHGSIPFNLINASSLQHLQISFNNLSGILPKNFATRYYTVLDLSYNSISGDISNLLLTSEHIFMSNNKFSGQLPQISNSVVALDLSYNSLSGPLSSLLCHTQTSQYYLGYLDLSNNYLTQELPDCSSNWTYLSYINLGNNRMVGQLPSTIGSLSQYLTALVLRNNGFSGDIPWTFHNCTALKMLNVEGNNFSGSIQTWIPQYMSVVKLRSNQFTGNISPHLCTLSTLIVLDLANNKLSWSIPHCLSNITSLFSELFDNYTASALTSTFDIPHEHEYMRIDLLIKGQLLEYKKNLKLVRTLDISLNKLTGEIPVELFKLTKLQSLNLSYNYLIGEISEQIGKMKNLESLDISHNNLQGNIPRSMSGLSFLSDLNMSYNHFSGQIPLGTQLQSFDAWSYTGNPELCGPPLQKNCNILKNADNTEQIEGNEDDTFLKSLYLGMGVGFATGFWAVCGSLFLNRAWRHTFFRFFYGVVDQIYVIVAIKLRRYRCMERVKAPGWL